jgi:hypothetical protein
MDDEDPVDTMPKIEEECRPQCSKVFALLSFRANTCTHDARFYTANF